MHSASAQPTVSKKLISFGWNYPSVNYLQKNLSQMEQYPVDGICFSFQKEITNAFDTAIKPDSYFQFNQLQDIPWKTFTDNFVILWGCGTTGPHWFDDRAWNKIQLNLKQISKAIQLSNAKGILFDPEYYLTDPNLNPWKYSSDLYQGNSYELVYSKVKERGCQFIKALQYSKPDIKIFCTWLLGLAIEQRKNNAVSSINQALLPAFIEGILEAKNNQATIIDGNETAYWYEKASDFYEARNYLQTNGTSLLKTLKNKNYGKVQIGQAVYADGLLAKFPQFEKGYDSITKHLWLYNNLLYALASSDEYAWIYTEKTTLWENEKDKSIKLIINKVKESLANYKTQRTPGLLKPNPLRKKINTIKNSALFLQDKNEIQFNFEDDIPDTIKIYKNSYCVQTIEKPDSRQPRVKLNSAVNQMDNISIITIKNNYFTAPKKQVSIIY